MNNENNTHMQVTEQDCALIEALIYSKSKSFNYPKDTSRLEELATFSIESIVEANTGYYAQLYEILQDRMCDEF